MPYKDIEKRRELARNHYQRNKDAYRKSGRKRKQMTRDWLRKYKTGLKCEMCPECRPAALTFHHIDPEQKKINIAEAVSNRWSPEKIMEEIKKCKVLCANCHLCYHDEN